jgi:hypothetical protein
MEASQNHSENISATYLEITELRTTEFSHTGHCKSTSESTDVKVQNVSHKL